MMNDDFGLFVVPDDFCIVAFETGMRIELLD